MSLLLPYQQRYIADKSRFKIGMFARQTGKTFTATYEIVDDALEAEAAGRSSPWVILSRSDRQARLALKEGVIRHLDAARIVYDAHEYPFDTRVTAHEVVLPGGTPITAIPANPDTARGYSRNALLDEFAIHKDSREIWGALFPVVSASWKLRVTSTPKGKSNKFYELMTDEDPIWSKHVVDIYQAVEQGLPRDIDALKRGLNDPDLWAQEFELEWLDEASSWLPFDLINACEDDDAGDPARYGGGPCFIGVDIAARNDLFVIWVVEAVGDVLWTREAIVRRRISFAEQDALLDDVFRRYRVIRCCMDQTGMGEKPVEDAQRRHGSMRVEGVLFTSPNKLTLATSGREAFEDRKIRIPQGDYALRSDLHALKKTTGSTGAPRFVVEGDAGGGHADRAWAIFLACHAASSPALPVEGFASGERRAAGAAFGAGDDLNSTRRGWGTIGGGDVLRGF